MTSKHFRYQKALANCSRVLLGNPDDEAQVQILLDQALEHLLSAVEASRVYVFRNYHHPELGFCMAMLAEVCAPGVIPQIQVEANQKYPWEDVPAEMAVLLKDGRPFGGPVDTAFANTPFLVQEFKNQPNPLQSVKLFPVHFGNTWWGFIGFDDVVAPRQWDENEVMVLQTASEMISSALQRWEVYFKLEEQVEERTSALRQSNRRLRRQIEQRRQAEAELAHRLEIERVMTTLSGRLLQQGRPIPALQDTLQELGQLVSARRMLLIFMEAEESPFDTPLVQWHSPETSSLPVEMVQRVSKGLPWMMAQLKQGNSITWDDPGDLPNAAAGEVQLMLSRYNISNMALYPVNTDDGLMAVLACASFDYEKRGKGEIRRILQLGTNLIENMVRREMILFTLEKRVVERTKELTTIFDIVIMGGQAETISDLLMPAVQRLAEAIDCPAVCIHLRSPHKDTLTLGAQIGLSADALENLVQIHPSPELKTLLQVTKKQALVGPLQDLPGRLATLFAFPEFETYFGTQLQAQGKLVGFLSAFRSEKKSFTINEISLLVVLAEQLGVLIENHRLHRETERMAIIGERQRLARELHDSITQSLYSQTLFARSGRYALEDNDPVKAQESLQQLESGAISTLKEMRLLLFQLQPDRLENLTLSAAIEQRFDDVERRLGIQAACVMPGHLDYDDKVISELYRVIMEALNNSLKHAQADKVTVTMLIEDDQAILRIVDNGIGFDLQNINPGMGLGYMCERVDHIQGWITMHSTPGEGTQIIVKIPHRNRTASK